MCLGSIPRADSLLAHHMFPDVLKHASDARRSAGRGESGWCSDMISTHGVWRHTGVRFLLSGGFMLVVLIVTPSWAAPRRWCSTAKREVFVLLACCALGLAHMPMPARRAAAFLHGVWRHTGVRFLLSGGCMLVVLIVTPSWATPRRWCSSFNAHEALRAS